jgi:hypothetical protein
MSPNPLQNRRVACPSVALGLDVDAGHLHNIGHCNTHPGTDPDVGPHNIRRHVDTDCWHPRYSSHCFGIRSHGQF